MMPLSVADAFPDFWKFYNDDTEKREQISGALAQVNYYELCNILEARYGLREAHNIERSLEGAPSTIAGVIRADGATAALADLLQQAAAADGRSCNGFERGKNPPREDRPAVVVEAVEVPACVPESHSISNNSPLAERVSVGRDTGVDTPAGSGGVASPAGASGQEDRATGAGGVPAQQGGPFRVDPSAPENFGSVNEVSAGNPAGV